MAKNYVDTKGVKKKKAKKAGLLIVAFFVIIALLLAKFALSDGVEFNSSGLPTNEDAYSVSKEFIRSTVRSNSVDFPDAFQVAKKDDSTYVIRASAELGSSNGEKKTADFRLLMQYKGGKHDLVKNWALLNISEH